MAKRVKVRVVRDTKIGGELVTVSRFDPKTKGRIDDEHQVVELEEREAGELLATGVAVLHVEAAPAEKAKATA